MNKRNYKDGRCSKIYYCKEPGCNNEISYPTWRIGKGRCHSCAQSGKKASNYIDGRSLKKYYCKDCGREISITSGVYGQGRCAKCANKIISQSESRNKKMTKTKIKHHVYLKENSEEVLILSRSKHTQLHNQVYNYLYNSQGKKGIDKYIKWFEKKFGIK